MRGNVITAVGIALLVGSLYVAVAFEFRHFYELLLVGSILVLHQIIPLSKLTLVQHGKLYAYFFLGGLVVDFLFAQVFTSLWHYNYENFLEYISLYFLVYPLGGYVMVWSFLSLEKYIPFVSRSIPINRNIKWNIYTLCMVIALLFVFLRYSFLSGLTEYFFSYGMVICTIILFSIISYTDLGRTYFGYLLANPVKVVLISLIVVLVNLLLHELPNVAAQQWVYTVSTGTFLDTYLFGIPVGVWLGWPTLLIGPLVMYYRVIAEPKGSV